MEIEEVVDEHGWEDAAAAVQEPDLRRRRHDEEKKAVKQEETAEAVQEEEQEEQARDPESFFIGDSTRSTESSDKSWNLPNNDGDSVGPFQ